MKTKFLLIALVVCLFSNAQAQVPSYVPSNGLVGWWPFNGNANDESGNGYNGTVNGSTLTSDRFGSLNNAYSFDGNDDISLNNTSSLAFSNGITFSAWINATTLKMASIVDKMPICPSASTYAPGFRISIRSNGEVHSGSGCYGVGVGAIATSAYSVGNWVFVVGTWEPSGIIKIFINGQSVQSIQTNNSSINCSDPVEIGKGNVTSIYERFEGTIDDIGIWNRALTQQEITNLYNSSAYVPCASPAFPANLANGLIGYWPFCGDANDESGNGNNGTVNGATLTSDRFGNPNSAYDFDGLQNYCTLPPMFDNGVNEFTISLWFNSDAPQTGTFSDILLQDANAVNSSNPANSIDLRYYLGSSVFRCDLGLNNPNPTPILPSPPTPLVWHNAVMCKSTTAFSLYIDGVLIQTVLGGGVYASYGQNLYVGNINLPGYQLSNGYTGSIDDIGIWNRALNVSEIQQLYNTSIYFQTVTGSCDTLQFNANITGFNPVTYQNQVKVFPNPAKDNLVIDCGPNFNTLTGYSMKILNTVGQSVYNGLITQQVTNIALTAPTWSPGAYIVQFINPTGTVIEAKQIIIQ
jgi:hypothetical protein